MPHSNDVTLQDLTMAQMASEIKQLCRALTNKDQIIMNREDANKDLLKQLAEAHHLIFRFEEALGTVCEPWESSLVVLNHVLEDVALLRTHDRQELEWSLGSIGMEELA